MGKIIIAYVPVIHRGYLSFFRRHWDATTLCILKEEIVTELDPVLRKDIRALDTEIIASLLSALPEVPFVQVVGTERLETLGRMCPIHGHLIVMPEEDLSRALAAKYLGGCRVEYDTVFLRWERRSILAEQEVRADRVIPFEGLVAEMMSRAYAEAEKGSNWWRRVGAVVARGGEVLLVAHNHQVPSPHTPYYEGDPRMFFKRGTHVELTTDDHAEARLISEAARKGIALEGADIYVTTFPCPPCAKFIAYSGIRRCYFAEGYSMLDGERILRDNDVEIIRVELKTPTP
ncbi:deoxycytidylate deaminase [Candidatus Parcubacteria bacterium]|nr:deoxycytidylate deaminase [Candidatus Parcubacteria bacterium]